MSLGSVVHERLCDVLTKKPLMKGIKKASPLAQTSYLEGFHSVLNHFAPKMLAYSYTGMYCRYNEYYFALTNICYDTGIVVIIVS